eukprot:TRINITY_DN7317_c0_g2_i2.p1 TRINITY_DN7317_c0_g2~~TRINITY_DN7317_c0_g2_i2.p1  ORF type:complete len:152 (+),score=14.87 TRINITY_DN7317_c0_g2_i2:152-607(+)
MKGNQGLVVVRYGNICKDILMKRSQNIFFCLLSQRIPLKDEGRQETNIKTIRAKCHQASRKKRGAFFGMKHNAVCENNLSKYSQQCEADAWRCFEGICVGDLDDVREMPRLVGLREMIPSKVSSYLPHPKSERSNKGGMFVFVFVCVWRIQ